MSQQVDIAIDTLTLENLTQKVKELVGNPLSTWAVAATLESLGIRDIDAEKEFGYASVFELADRIYEDLKGEFRSEDPADRGQPRMLDKPSAGKSVALFGKYYILGILFSLPMVSQVLAVLIFRYSLWAWIEFNEAQATMVAFGTIVAFVITGGFIQALGRAVSRYKGEKNYQLAFEATKRIMNKGVLCVGIVAIVFYLINILFPFYPQGMILLSLVYMVLISLLLLASGVLYALEHRLMILLGVLLGTAFVIIGMDVLDIGIYFSQWIGMIISIVFLAAYGYLYYKFKIRFSTEKLNNADLPKPEIRYYNYYRFFVYGACYFLFLFLDRLLAWSAGSPPPPYLVWFNTPYELGMDWALITLILTVAVLEYSVNAFSRQLLPLQKKVRLMGIDLFNKYFKSFYYKQLVLLLAVGTASIAVTYYGISSLKVLSGEVQEIRDFFANPMTTRVFWLGSIGYLFLIIGLLHSLFFFTLNRSSYVMYAMVFATIINFFVGYICSRVISLEYAAIGLIAGSIAFAAITGWLARRFFKRLDYYYYSAF